jgi:endonuclease/exonuclease/phosphatase family metal-dependent hydrolase
MLVLTVNLCAASSAAKLAALRSFLLHTKVDIALLQEVSVASFGFPEFQEVVNIGEGRRGTAVLAKHHLALTSSSMLPCGRGTAVKVGNTTYICVYAPSVSRLRADRARFFAETITPLLAGANGEIVLAGDFNCTNSPSETTGVVNKCRQLTDLTSQLHLTDVWPTLRAELGHTFFTVSVSSRLDRIYASPATCRAARCIETSAVSFSDHMAVICKFDQEAPPRTEPTSRARASWTLDISILHDEDFQEYFKQQWRLWTSRRPSFKHAVDWWLRIVKPGIRRVAAEYTREKRRLQNIQLNFLHSALQELSVLTARSAADMQCVKDIKKAINDIHADRLRGFGAKAKTDSVVDGEPVSMHHIFKYTKRKARQSISQLTTDDGRVLDSSADITEHLLDVFTSRFSAPDGAPPPASTLAHLERSITEEDNESLCQPITLEELTASVRACRPGKSAGEDGIIAELYQVMWPIIGHMFLQVVNDMWTRSHVPEEMVRGIVVLIPKTNNAKKIKDLRPLTLLNVDVKLFSRVLASRISKVLPKLLHPGQVQPGGVRNMAAALCDLRDTISYLDCTSTPGCILSVDLAAAFDCVRHDFLFAVLSRRGLAPSFAAALNQMYSGASSQLRVNGDLTTSFPVGRSVRQGCPLSAILFAVVLSPLMFRLHERLQGVGIADSLLRVSAYADDIYGVLRGHQDAVAVREELDDFSQVSGLKSNALKSRALPVGSWCTTQ